MKSYTSQQTSSLFVAPEQPDVMDGLKVIERKREPLVI